MLQPQSTASVPEPHDLRSPEYLLAGPLQRKLTALVPQQWFSMLPANEVLLDSHSFSGVGINASVFFKNFPDDFNMQPRLKTNIPWY